MNRVLHAAVKAPEMLILDESFSNLDPVHTQILKEVLENIAGHLEITCLLASHNPSDTLSWANEIFVLKMEKLYKRVRHKRFIFIQ